MNIRQVRQETRGQSPRGLAWLLAFTCLACLPCSAQTPAAATEAAAARAAETAATAPPSRGVIVVEISGMIAPSLVPRVRQALAPAEAGRHPAPALLVLDSAGGDGLAAMEIGRIARAAGAHAFVRGRCASACTFILAGSVVRGAAGEHAVGLHRGRVTGFVRGRGTIDIDTASSPKAAEALQVAERQMAEFLREMDMPDALFRAMTAVPSSETRYPDASELASLGLIGFDAAYRKTRAPEAAARYQVTEEEFVRRTMRVPQSCLAAGLPPAQIVGCYRRVLQTGE